MTCSSFNLEYTPISSSSNFQARLSALLEKAAAITALYVFDVGDEVTLISSKRSRHTFHFFVNERACVTLSNVKESRTGYVVRRLSYLNLT